jgi:hypothetical protein
MFRFIQIQICGVPLITRRNLQTIFDSESERSYQSYKSDHNEVEWIPRVDVASTWNLNVAP